MTFRKIKDPDAVLDYSIDWSAWLVDDTITTSSWSVTGADSDLTVDSDSKSTTATTVWLSGGTLGLTYTVTNRITTGDGRTDDRSIAVDVLEK
ncbi:hypothetical protein [Haliea salexigens]|uniref:phage fiber-tail adaptor protein n=1 Tax=Haliea salexigens TaxID=287487 RepID=UPI0004115737|nr:hypothetical protein [Haliea salexigens]